MNTTKGKEMKTMLPGEIKCPTCGGDIIEIDTLDIEEGVSEIRLFKVGECDHCGNHYQWHEEFTYCGHTELEYTESEDECEPDDLECGFDPYAGCYTYDC